MCFLRFNCCYKNNKRNCNENAYSKYNEQNDYSNECGCKEFDRDDNYHDNNKKSNCCYYKCVTLCCDIYDQHEDNKREKCNCDRRKNSYWD